MTIQDFRLEQKKPDATTSVLRVMENIKEIPSAELLQLREAIGLQLNLGVDQINTSEELTAVYYRSKQLLSDIQDDEGTPANQKAQVLNSVQALLERVIKLQAQTYNVERQRKYEQALVRTLKEFDDPDLQDKFFSIYANFLGAVNDEQEAVNVEA